MPKPSTENHIQLGSCTSSHFTMSNKKICLSNEIFARWMIDLCRGSGAEPRARSRVRDPHRRFEKGNLAGISAMQSVYRCTYSMQRAWVADIVLTSIQNSCSSYCKNGLIGELAGSEFGLLLLEAKCIIPSYSLRTKGISNVDIRCQRLEIIHSLWVESPIFT